MCIRDRYLRPSAAGILSRWVASDRTSSVTTYGSAATTCDGTVSVIKYHVRKNAAATPWMIVPVIFFLANDHIARPASAIAATRSSACTAGPCLRLNASAYPKTDAPAATPNGYQ